MLCTCREIWCSASRQITTNMFRRMRAADSGSHVNRQLVTFVSACSGIVSYMLRVLLSRLYYTDRVLVLWGFETRLASVSCLVIVAMGQHLYTLQLRSKTTFSLIPWVVFTTPLAYFFN